MGFQCSFFLSLPLEAGTVTVSPGRRLQVTSTSQAVEPPGLGLGLRCAVVLQTRRRRVTVFCAALAGRADDPDSSRSRRRRHRDSTGSATDGSVVP
jgi:hypothetical protein